jgi:hypothetical protein
VVNGWKPAVPFAQSVERQISKMKKGIIIGIIIVGVIFMVTPAIQEGIITSNYNRNAYGQLVDTDNNTDTNTTNNKTSANDQVLRLIEHCFTDTDGDNYKKELVAQGLIDPEFSDYTCREINRMVVEITINLVLKSAFG